MIALPAGGPVCPAGGASFILRFRPVFPVGVPLFRNRSGHPILYLQGEAS